MQTASEEHFTRSDVWNSRILRHDGTDGIKADARGPTAQLEMKCKNPKSPTAVAKGFSSAKVYQLSRWEKKGRSSRHWTWTCASSGGWRWSTICWETLPPLGGVLQYVFFCCIGISSVQIHVPKNRRWWVARTSWHTRYVTRMAPRTESGWRSMIISQRCWIICGTFQN